MWPTFFSALQRSSLLGKTGNTVGIQSQTLYLRKALDQTLPLVVAIRGLCYLPDCLCVFLFIPRKLEIRNFSQNNHHSAPLRSALLCSALLRSAPLVCCSARLMLRSSATPLVCCFARLLLCPCTPLFNSFSPLSSSPWRTLLPSGMSAFFVSFCRSRLKTALPPTG